VTVTTGRPRRELSVRTFPVWTWTVAVGALAALVAALHSTGPGFVLDDWYLVGRVSTDGALGVVGPDLLASRPGSFLVYATSFGVAAGDPHVVQVVQASWLVAVAALAFRLLRRFVPLSAAAGTVALWLVLPNHISLEIWGSALVASASLAYLLGASLLLSSTTLRPWKLACACVLAALSCLTYEASIAPAAAAFVALPWLVQRRTRWDAVGAGVVTLSSVLLWQVTHWHSVKSIQRDPAAITQSVAAHFGWGIVPDGAIASVAVCVALVGTVLVVHRLLVAKSGGPSEWLVVAGWAIVLLGTIPFTLYFYAPLGAGDRATYVSGFGGAMVWVGLIWCVGRTRPAVALCVAAALVAAGGVVRLERMEVWHTAAEDGRAIVAAVDQVDPSCAVIVLGPKPIQRQNVAAFLDQSNVDGMVASRRPGDGTRGGIAFSTSDFEARPEACRVDTRPLSDLESDVDLGP
jgi:hypothetical protein